jgi:predicted permease
MIVNPGTVGLAIGLPLFFASISLPAILKTPISLLAGLNTPLAMLVIGFYLAGADFRRVVRMPSAYLAAAVRLIVYPLAMVALLFPLRTHFPREMMLALVTAASAPVAAMVSMFASKFERDVDLSVGLVSGTTLLSIITMPPVIALAMLVIGFYLAGADFRRVVRMPSAYLAAAVRLVVFPLALLALLYPLRSHFPREMMLALVTAASAPVAAMVSMFASKFSRDVDLSVGLDSGTTLLSIFTMPPVIALAMEVL